MFAIAVTMSCIEANLFLNRLLPKKSIPDEIKIEIIQEIKKVSPKNCTWKHNDGISSP